MCRRGAVVKGVEYISTILSGAGSSPAGSVGRDLNLQKLNYQFNHSCCGSISCPLIL